MRPILFYIGPLPIRTWGVLVAAGFIAGLVIAAKRANKKDIATEKIYDLALFVLILSLVFGRIVFVLFNLKFYLSNPVQILMIHEGGMSIHGALIGGFLATYLYCKRNKISILLMGDILVPSIFIGQAIGRLGCFFNGCDYGIVTNSFLGVKFPNLGGLRYPTQLFESFLDIIAFVIVIYLSKKIKKEGLLLFISIIIYSTIRFLVEFLRDDMIQIINGVTWGQAASIIMIIIAIVLIYFNRKKARYEN